MQQYLSDKEPGESIIRPSSKGPSFLTLTLKVFDGVYAHKEIVEGGKDHKNITSLLRLGKTLTIDKDTFEDLDEVSAHIYYYILIAFAVFQFSVMIILEAYCLIL